MSTKCYKGETKKGMLERKEKNWGEGEERTDKDEKKGLRKDDEVVKRKC